MSSLEYSKKELVFFTACQSSSQQANFNSEETDRNMRSSPYLMSGYSQRAKRFSQMYAAQRGKFNARFGCIGSLKLCFGSGQGVASIGDAYHQRRNGLIDIDC